MSRVIGFHVIACTYGFWLPNEQRGSCSDFVRSPALAQFGPPNTVTHRRSVARQPYDRTVRRMQVAALRYPPVVLTDPQIAAACRGIAREIETHRAATVHALAQLRNHFHLVCGPCRYDIRRFAGRLKSAATRALLEAHLHPLHKFSDPAGNAPSPWSVKPWVVYLFTPDDMIRSIDYARANLARAGLPPQDHAFVLPYRGTTENRKPIDAMSHL